MTSFTCRVELDKTKGVVITVENEEGKITQTLVMDGTTITTTCKGNDETSTITQGCDSIALVCKTFTLDAETICCRSTKDTTHSSDQKFSLSSAQDMTLTSKAYFTGKATSTLKLDAQEIKASAQNKLSASGMSLDLSGTSTTKIAGGSLSLSGDASSELSGGSVKVSSSSTLNVEGQLTTLKGQMTNVQGSLVNIG